MLVGRERELEALREQVPLTVLEGAPGIGKTRLLQAAVGMSRVPARTARASELERELPFGVIRQLLAGVDPGQLTGAAALAAPVLDPRPAGVTPVFDAPPGAADFAVLHGLYWVVAGLGPVVLAVADLLG